MPTRRPFLVTGMPLISCCRIRATARCTGASGSMVTGSTTMPLSYFLTLVTSSACCWMVRFLCTNPSPPSCAMAMAVRASVTVSMAALTMGMRSRRFLVSWAPTSTCRGRTSLSAGRRRTSSKVRASGTLGSIISGLRYRAFRAAGKRASVAAAKRPGNGGFVWRDRGRVYENLQVPDTPATPPPPGRPGNGKRPSIGLQVKLPCATPDEVRSRYGSDLRHNAFFIRTRSPRPVETLVRLEAQLASGQPGFRAACVVVEVTDAGMRLQLVGVDEAGRELIASLGGVPPALLKSAAPVAVKTAPAAEPTAPAAEAAAP